MISVLLPTYGRPELLAESVECFLRQTIIDSELIILNDWHDQFIICDHPRIRVYNQTERISLGMKRNFLCDYARGDLVVDWDDDDIYLPTHLEHTLSMMPLYRGSVAAKQKWQWMDTGGSLYRMSVAGYMHTVILKKDFRVSLGGYADQTRHSDIQFLERILKAGALFGPHKMFHKPTFIQRYNSGREHVSTDKGNTKESDSERHARIDREIERIGVTGELHIVPGWKADYQKISDDSYDAAIRNGWGQ